ncbi:MAG: enoyl-CoA hydratase/isomerase family protein, partial [Gordonia sp. (in: high G+C Gram-positive bacteria)]
MSSVAIMGRPTSDRRCVYVDDVDAAVAQIAANVRRHPVAAAITDDVLRADTGAHGIFAGLVTESLAYSTLQAGTDFRQWLAGRAPAWHQQHDPVVAHRDGDHLDIAFNRPAQHNAFSNALRAGLIDALTVAVLDVTIAAVTLRGVGRSFCSGGDLGEFGLLDDPASAHVARTRHSPALVIDRLTGRLGDHAAARVHGAVLGSGLEMAAFFGRICAHPRTRFGLPELGLGLLPGAGGTVSITRRIGRWRTAYLILSGRQIDA